MLPPTLLALAAGSALFGLLTFLDLHADLTDKRRILSELIGQSLVGALWNMNNNQVQAILDAFVLDPEIDGLSVLATDGAVLASAGLSGGPPSLVTERAISHQGVSGRFTLGFLNIIYSDAPITGTISRLVMRDVAWMILLTLILVGGAVVANRRIVAMPLNRFLDRINRTTATGKPSPIEDIPDDEIGRVIEAYNMMVDHLDEEREKLKAAKAQAEAANQAKSKFLAAASHDLRQPLQALRLLSTALAETMGDGTAVKPERVLKITGSIEQSVGGLSDLLHTLLDVSKLDAGVVQAAVRPFPLADLLAASESTFRATAGERGLDLRIVVTTAVIESDPVLLKQIIDNLISNAIRYTDYGRVLVGCRRRGGHLAIEVWDTGVGIDEADQQSVFEEFRQIDNPARNREKGLGLGLSIVKRTADLLAHPIDLRSRRGRGSMFRVTVPLAGTGLSISPPVPDGPTPDSDTATRHILVIEDDDHVLEASIALLEAWGHRVIGTADPKWAIDRTRDGEPVDLVLVDYQLSEEMDGLGVYREIVDTAPNAPAGIVVSGNTNPADLDRISASGLAYLAKPIDPDALRNLLRRALTC